VGTSVRDRYLVGKLAPRESPIDQADTSDLAESGGDRGDDGGAQGTTLMSQSIVPSSFGLTFCGFEREKGFVGRMNEGVSPPRTNHRLSSLVCASAFAAESATTRSDTTLQNRLRTDGVGANT
jgi:hypothetical protein